MAASDRLKPTLNFKSYKRNLPHYEQPGSIYFITFKTMAGIILTDTAKDLILSAILYHDNKKYILEACVVMKTHVHCIIKPLTINNVTPVPISNVAQASSPVSGGISTPAKSYYSIAQITHSIKSYSAKKILKLFNRKGNIWQDEHYDRTIRAYEEFEEKLYYIINNPVKAGIVRDPDDYPWLFIREKSDYRE